MVFMLMLACSANVEITIPRTVLQASVAERFPIEGATFLKSTTGRRGLAMRRLDYVYVGTSDDEYSGPLGAPRCTRADVLDLLAMVQDCFPEAGLMV